MKLKHVRRMNLTPDLHEAQSSNYQYSRRNCQETKHNIQMKQQQPRNTHEEQQTCGSLAVGLRIVCGMSPPSLSSHEQVVAFFARGWRQFHRASLTSFKIRIKPLRRRVEHQPKSCCFNQDSTTTLHPKQAVAIQKSTKLKETWKHHFVQLKDHFVVGTTETLTSHTRSFP